jgi:hypothetical protein
METQLKRGRSHIYSAILKDGLENFSLEILEFCEPEMCIKREDYYIKLLNSAYNIIKDPLVPPMYGRNHSEETREKMRNAQNSGWFTKGVINNGNPPQKIEVFDLNKKETIVYGSINEAARALDIKHHIISQYFIRNQQKPYKGRFVFTKV